MDTEEKPLGEAVLGSPDEIADLLLTELPSLRSAHGEIVEELHSLMSFLHSGTHGTALGTVATQTTNTFVDLLYDVERGRGRAATAGVRVLFELLVTTLDIVDSPELDARYRAHEWVTMQQEAELAFELPLLPKKERRSLEHRQKKARRDFRPKYDDALAQYGRRFAFGWAPSPLADRAERHGLADEYFFYRVASALLHGAYGGVAGLRKTVGESTVFRFGQALALCPRAYLGALQYYERFVTALGDRGGLAGAEILTKLRALQRAWPEYRRAINRLDRKIWPTHPPPGPMLILGVKDSGRFRRWYVHDVAAGRITEAVEPTDLPEGQARMIEELVAEIAERADPGELVTIAVLGARPVAKSGARWQPETSILASS